MLGIRDRHLRIAKLCQAIAEELFHKKLLFYPHGYCGAETDQSAWSKRVISFQQALELEERLVVKCHCRERIVLHTRFFENIANGISRKRRIVLLAREPFLLRRRCDFTVNEERCCAVVVVSRDAEY